MDSPIIFDNTELSFFGIEDGGTHLGMVGSEGEITTSKFQSREALQQVRLLKKELEFDRKEAAKWREEMDRKMNIIMKTLGCEDPDDESQSLLKHADPRVFVLPKKKDPTFVTIRYPDGKTEDVSFSEDGVRDIMSAATTREIVRKVLLYLHDHDISKLRNFTLTGKTSKKMRFAVDVESESQGYLGDAESQGVDNEKFPLPLRTRLIAQEVVLKLNPVDSQLIECAPKFAAEHETKLRQDARTSITAVLNYFFGNYDSNGNKLS